MNDDEWRQMVIHVESMLDTISNLPTRKLRDGVYVLRAEMANMRALAECEPSVSQVPSGPSNKGPSQIRIEGEIAG